MDRHGEEGDRVTEDELRELQLRYAIANLTAPWYLRLRWRVAFYVGHELGLVRLGYLIDYDRDRYSR